MYEREKNEIAEFWAKIKSNTGEVTLNEMIKCGNEEIEQWQFKSNVECKPGLNYVYTSEENYKQAMAIQTRDEKISKFTKSVVYSGADGSAEKIYRVTGHHNNYEQKFDQFLLVWRLQNKKDVAIYYSSANDRRLYYATESITIDNKLKELDVNIKNVQEGHSIDKYMTDYDRSEFSSVLISLMSEAVERPIIVKITSQQQINSSFALLERRTHSKVHFYSFWNGYLND